MAKEGTRKTKKLLLVNNLTILLASLSLIKMLGHVQYEVFQFQKRHMTAFTVENNNINNNIDLATNTFILTSYTKVCEIVDKTV